MTTTTHPNSKKITVFRSNNFIQSAQNDPAAQDFMSNTVQSIGPYWQSHAGQVIGSGLSIPEQNLLMPFLIQITSEDKDFRKEIFKYFNNLKTGIPFSTGKDLEIGLEQDNSKPVSKDNIPLNVEHFVRYRHIKNHPWVAGNLFEAKGNPRKYFYIHDADLQLVEDTDKLVIQDEADGIWLKIKEQSPKVTMLLTLLGFDEREYVGRNGEIRKKNELRGFIDKKATEFLKVYKEDRFETRYWLKAMVLADVVKQHGTSFVIKENSKLLGKSELETLIYIEDETNVDTITYLKGITQDALRKPKTPRKKLA